MFSECMMERDIVFAVDISGSQEFGVGLETQVEFIRQIVKGLYFKIGRTRIGYMTYSSRPDVQFYLNQYTSLQAQRDILNAIHISSVGYGTNIGAALKEIRLGMLKTSKGDRKGVKDVVIMLGDGRATMNGEDPIAEANLLKKRPVDMFTVAVGEYFDFTVLEGLSSSPLSKRMYSLTKRNQLEVIVSKILNEICI